MPRYHAIHRDLELLASNSDMTSLEWRKPRLVADFRMPGNATKVIRVEFEEALTFRALDEMPLSTEAESGPNIGLVPEHFAYRVEDAAFFRAQSEAFLQIHRGVEHYRFITGWTCLDVISRFAPSIDVLPRAP